MNIIDHISSHPGHARRFNPYNSCEAYLTCEADRLIAIHDKDPLGALYLVTGTFPGRRFKGTFDAQYASYKTMRLAERFCDDLMSTFRMFYIKMLERTVPKFRKRHHDQPQVLAFIDDKQGAERYLHVHSVWHLPSSVMPDVRRWLCGAGALREWRRLTGSGTLDVREIAPTDEDVRRACSYSGKLMPRAEALGVPSGAFCRTFPDLG